MPATATAKEQAAELKQELVDLCDYSVNHIPKAGPTKTLKADRAAFLEDRKDDLGKLVTKVNALTKKKTLEKDKIAACTECPELAAQIDKAVAALDVVIGDD